jgi:hypothetical protein
MANHMFFMKRASHAELRQADRVAVAVKVNVRQRGAKGIAVVMEDVSCGGCRVQWPHLVSPGDRVWIGFPGLEAISAIVVWTADFKFGCRFDVPLHTAVFRQLIRQQLL